jgi:hypothetical protein
MRTRGNLFAIGSLLVLVACGGGGSGPPPSPTLTSVTIVAQDGILFLGQTYTFSMSARLSDGATVTTGGTWGSDAPAVATVNSVSGSVQIVGLGEATIFVDYQGQRGTRRIRTTVRYEGTLDGVMRLTGCSQTGEWATGKACDEFRNGDEFLALGTFTQSETTVTAVMDLGDGDDPFPAPPVAATISGSGELRLESVHRDGGLTGRAQWVFRPTGLTQIEGTIVIRWTASGVSGFMENRANILPTTIIRTLGEAGGGQPRRSMRNALRVMR